MNGTSNFVCRFIMPSLKSRLDLTPMDSVVIVRKVYHVVICYKTAWTALTKALAKIFINWEKSYETFLQYL